MGEVGGIAGALPITDRVGVVVLLLLCAKSLQVRLQPHVPHVCLLWLLLWHTVHCQMRFS